VHVTDAVERIGQSADRRGVDVLIDRLEMCHVVDFRDRIDRMSLTLDVTDLLLSKLQIVELNEKDAADILHLLSAYPVRPGITFTYLGTRVNRDARMLMADGTETENLFAAGEIMAGNVLGRGYAAGVGMTIGSVFGRIAGEGAARNARG
jgi:succinate dehydrogenase/fumarate reductase flavoprotein subunit